MSVQTLYTILHVSSDLIWILVLGVEWTQTEEFSLKAHMMSHLHQLLLQDYTVTELLKKLGRIITLK